MNTRHVGCCNNIQRANVEKLERSRKFNRNTVRADKAGNQPGGRYRQTDQSGLPEQTVRSHLGFKSQR